MNKIKLFFSTLYRIVVASYKILTAKQPSKEPFKINKTSQEVIAARDAFNIEGIKKYKEEFAKEWPTQPQRVRDKQLQDILKLCSVENQYNENDQERLQKMREFVAASRNKKA